MSIHFAIIFSCLRTLHMACLIVGFPHQQHEEMRMAKVTKTWRVEDSLLEKLSDIANEEFDGNVTAALEAFLEQGVALRTFTEQERWFIYSKSNSVVHQYSKTERGSFEEAQRIRSLTTALWV